MNDLRLELAETIARVAATDGLHELPVKSAHCIKLSETDERTKRHWRASLGIVAQGCKELVLNGEVYRRGAFYRHADCFARRQPRFRRFARRAVFVFANGSRPVNRQRSRRAFGTGFCRGNRKSAARRLCRKADDKMLVAAIRLAQLFETPDDAPVLGNLIVKEIFYHLLKGAEGASIRQCVRAGSRMHEIAEAIQRLNSEPGDQVTVEALARRANMSRSTFSSTLKKRRR